VPLKYNNMSPPNTLNTLDDMQDICHVKTIALVRNPIDVWLSMKNSPKTFHDIHLNYLSLFVNDILNRQIPILKYEDLTKSPDSFMDQFYTHLNVTNYSTVTASKRLSKNVTGDIQFTDISRNYNKKLIQPIKRRPISAEDRTFLLNKTCASRIMELLGYDNIF